MARRRNRSDTGVDGHSRGPLCARRRRGLPPVGISDLDLGSLRANWSASCGARARHHLQALALITLVTTGVNSARPWGDGLHADSCEFGELVLGIDLADR